MKETIHCLHGFRKKKKTYDRVNWMALWDVLNIYGVRGKLLSAIKSFYEDASACIKINGETNEHYDIKVGLGRGVSCHHGCSIFIWMVL